MTELTFHELIVKDFLSYNGEHHLALDKGGLIYVKGENRVGKELTSNDCGKSSLFNALIWCLYGRTLRSARPGNAISPWGESGNPDVSIIFERAGNRYVVRRTRSPNNACLNHEIVEQVRITEALGLSYEAFIHTIVIGQFNELFLSLRPEEQTNLFTELLDLEIWIRSVENATKRLRSTESLLANTERTIERYKGSLQEVSEQIIKLMEYSASWETKHQAEIKKLQAAVKVTTEDHQALKGMQPKAADTQEDEEAVADGTVELVRLRGFLRDERVNRDKVSAEHNKTLGMINATQFKLGRYKSAQGACPECGQSVTDQHIEEQRANITAELEASRNKSKEHSNKLQTHNDQITDYEKQITEVQELIDEIQPRILKAKHAQLLWEQKVKTAEITRNSAIQDFNRCDAEVNEHENLLKQASQRELEIRSNLKESETAHGKFQAETTNIKYWIESFKKIRLDLIDETLAELEFSVARRAESLGLSGWRISFATERETAKGEIRSKFSASLYAPLSDEAVPLEAIGGGVTQRWQMATVLGLSDVLLARAGLTTNLLVMDEPTHHMSELGIENLLECLSELTDKTVFFIDHAKLENGLFTSTLNVIKDENGSRFEYQ